MSIKQDLCFIFYIVKLTEASLTRTRMISENNKQNRKEKTLYDNYTKAKAVQYRQLQRIKRTRHK